MRAISFVDDFSSSGDTLRDIVSAIGTGAEHVGTYLWSGDVLTWETQ